MWHLHVSLLSPCTFRVLHRVAAHSLSAVEAVHFDGTQTQHLGVLTNSINLISDPFQGHNLALFETGREINFKKAQRDQPYSLQH